MKYKDMFSLNGKIVVITGGAGLIGKELVKGLAEFGADVIVADVDKNNGKKVENKLKQQNLNVVFKYLDITKEKSIVNLIKYIKRKYRSIDIWINNAYPRTNDWNKKLEDIKFSSWKKNIDAHLNGYFICCQKICEVMKKQRSGSIINFGSIYGTVGPEFSIYKGINMTVPAPYSAIKGGIINFTKYLASYYGKYNVRVNCVSPGGVYNNQPIKFVRRYNARTPLRRMASKEDIVGGVIYLVSDASKYVTGHNLIIDGGWTIT